MSIEKLRELDKYLPVQKFNGHVKFTEEQIALLDRINYLPIQITGKQITLFEHI